MTITGPSKTRMERTSLEIYNDSAIHTLYRKMFQDIVIQDVVYNNIFHCEKMTALYNKVSKDFNFSYHENLTRTIEHLWYEYFWEDVMGYENINESLTILNKLYPNTFKSKESVISQSTINQPINQPQPKKEEEKMSSVNAKLPVQQVTFVYGKDITTLSDDELFTTIRNHEAEIASLSSIENKPKKLVAKIDSLKKAIQAIVAVMDSRE